MKTKKRKKLRVAYSYKRWSKAIQGKGDSRRRQSAERLCKRKGWILDHSLQLTDEGVSGFRGRNSEFGALASFLHAVSSGIVKRGSILIIEDLDRLSRQNLGQAFPLFQGLIDAGIGIYVVRSEKLYHSKNVDNPAVAMEVALALALAHDESRKKCYRASKWWERRRERAQQKGLPITRYCPSWLRYVRKPRGFALVPDAAAVLRRVRQLVLDGHGLGEIAQQLAAEGVPAIGRSGRWQKSFLQKTMHNRELLGEYQPHIRRDGKRIPSGESIANYFPPVFTVEEFREVAAVLRNRRKQTGPAANTGVNLFTGLLRAGDSSLILVRSIVKGRDYYYLTTGQACNIPYPKFERSILRCIVEITEADLIGTNQQDAITALAAKLADKKDRVSVIQQSLESDGDVTSLVTVLRKLELQIKQMEEQLEEARVKADAHSPAALRQTQSILATLDDADGERREALRVKLKTRLKLLLSRIDVEVEGEARSPNKLVWCQMHFHTGQVRQIWFQTGTADIGVWVLQHGKRVKIKFAAL